MALVVWLPLNGNLENQGASSITVTNHNGTVDNSGKIGKCYLLNGTNAYINGIYNATIEMSFCCWANFPSIKSAHLFDARTSGGTGYQPMYVTASSIQIGASGSNYANFSQTFSNNTWYHICVTHNGTEGKCYINGTLIGTSTAAKGANMGTCVFTLGSRCNQSNYQNAKINDVRIYNHCLSAAEVHEISQGLVLHYKLDGTTDTFLPLGYQQLEYIEGTGASYINTGYRFNPETDSCKVIFKGNDTSNNGMVFASNGSKYFWFYYYGSSGMRLYANNGSGQQGIAGIAKDTNQHTMEYKNKHYYIDNSDKGSLSNTYTEDSNPIYLFSYGGANYVFKGRIYYVEILRNNILQKMYIPVKRISDSKTGMYEIMNHEFLPSNSSTDFTAGAVVQTPSKIIDSSGYGYNGTIVGTPTLTTNTARYSSAIIFNGTERINTTTPGADIRTLSCWCKTSKNKSTSQHMVADSFSGMCISFYNGKIIGVFSSSGGAGSKSILGDSYKENDWNHIVVVKTGDSGQRDIYCNGVKLTPDSNDYWNAATGFFVGARNTSQGNAFYGQISDVRAYCTALSAADVKQLYEMGAKIDNKGSLHTYEFNEFGSNKLKKTGVFYNYATEPYMQLTDGSCWKLMLFHYVDGGNNLFTSSNATYNDGFGLYSRLRDIDNFKYNNKYEFYVIQDDVEYRWTQTNAPMTSTAVAGYTAITGTPGGICKCSGNTVLAASNTTSNWWRACGCWTVYNGGIPGFGSSVICKRYLALYARIDKITYRNASNAHYANNLIEI